MKSNVIPLFGDLDDDGGIKSARLQQLIKDHDGSVRTTITPRMATLLMDHNTSNRRFSPGRKDQFTFIINAGRWINTGEPVIISKGGRLSEGQHRLAAIIETQTAVECDISFGISDEAFWVTGTGATRVGADVLSIIGVKYPIKIAAGLRMLIWYERGLPDAFYDKKKIPNDDIIGAYNRWPDISHAYPFLSESLRTHYKAVNAAALAWCYLALRQKNESIVGQFLEEVRTGLVDSERNPARKLREWMHREGPMVHGDDNVLRLAVWIKAWNFWLAGDYDSRLTWRDGGKEVYPSVHVSLDRPTSARLRKVRA